MRNGLLVALCALFAFFVWNAAVQGPYLRTHEHAWTGRADPFAPAALRARMERIAPVVSRVVGDAIDVTRIRIRAVDDRFANERRLADKFPHLLDTTKDDFRQRKLNTARASLSRRNAVLGIYRAPTETIELYPHLFDSIVPEAIDAVLDIVVAHELAHAWQDQHYGVFENTDTSDREPAYARRAVIEGSAEFVAQCVARELGMASVFARKAAARSREDDPTLVMWKFRLTRNWFYVEGLTFIEAVHRSWQGAPDWKGLFSRMPLTVADIQRPREWLASRRLAGEQPNARVDRFLREVAGNVPDSTVARRWWHAPILIVAVRDRVALAALPPDHAAWRACTGGLALNGRPDAGALAEAGVSIRVWRIGTGMDASAARASLERAAKERGARSWIRDEFVEFAGPVRFRAGSGRAVAYAQSGMDRVTGDIEEHACAFGSHGQWLFEASTDCIGGSPALLELLEFAMRSWLGNSTPAPALTVDERGLWDLPGDASPYARDRLIVRALARAGGEREVADWLRGRAHEPSAYFTALGRAVGDDRWRTLVRGESLIAALRHEDADVRRFALHSLAQGVCELRPFAPEVPTLVREAADSPDAEIRALAVEAAYEFREEEVLSQDRLQELLSDPSPFVRAALARNSSRLTDEACERLLGDLDPIVRAAAETNRERWGGMRTFERLARQSEQPMGEVRAYAQLDSLLAVDWDELSETERRSNLARLRRLIAAKEDVIRLCAIHLAQHVSGNRSSLVPALLDAFAIGPHRRAAAAILRAGELDLAPHRSRLVRMLDSAFTRVEVLRVLAAQNVALDDDTRARIRAWTRSPDPALACAAALVVDDDQTIEQHWRAVQREFRIQIIDTLLRRRPDAPLAQRLREEALLSPYRDEREAVFDALEAGQFNTAHWNALLARIGTGGSEVAGACWDDLMGRFGALSPADTADAKAIVTRHLTSWCDRDRLPLLSWHDDRMRLRKLDRWPVDPAYRAALDRCIVRKDAAATRLVLGLTREAITDGDLPGPVADALQNLFAASPHSGIPAAIVMHKTATRRGFVRAETLCHLIRCRADTYVRSWGRHRYTPRWVGSGPGRARAARALVPELLERDDGPHLLAALGILSELETASADDLVRLRELAARALPSWRECIEDCIDDLTVAR